MELSIWNRSFSLEIEYDCYTGESVTDEQKKAVNDFVSHPEWVVGAKTIVEDFCKEKVMLDAGNNRKENIFSYIKPDYLYVKHDNVYPRVAIMCKYRYDPEHGIAIVFSHKGEITVCVQDEIL